jgi:hypothetical protein
MTDGAMTVPDLAGGFIVNGFDKANRWQTFIEAALCRRDADGETRWAYLSTPCRAEFVTEQRIFGERYAEVVRAHTWDGTFTMRSGAALYRLNPWRNRRPGAIPAGAAASRLHYSPSEARDLVNCDAVTATEVAYADLLASLQGPVDGRDNRLYFQVAWREGERAYDLFAPCRYINFPNPETAPDESYVQPISGYVLVESEGLFRVAYVSAHVTPAGTRRAEICTRQPISYLETKKRTVRPSLMPALRLLDRLIFGRLFITDEFCGIRSIAADCRFYRYA